MILYALAFPLLNNSLSISRATAMDVDQQCNELNHCRTLTNIIYNCLSVIVLCVWTSVHPNVPLVSQSSTRWKWDRLQISFVALFLPELILVWAMRDWYNARRVFQKYKKYGWTKAHAFLALMGGLALYEHGVFKCHLWPEPLDQLQEETIAREIENRMTTREKETLLSSLSNERPLENDQNLSTEQQLERSLILTQYSSLLEFSVAKGFVHIDAKFITDNLGHASTLQATWFVLQCLGRGVEGLGLTQLEVLTLAFATLNALSYILWWYKPQGLFHPIPVDWHPEGDPAPENDAKNVKHALFDQPKQGHRAGIMAGVIHAEIFSPVAWLYQLFSNAFFGLNTMMKESGKAHLFSLSNQRSPIYQAAVTYLVAIAFGALHCISWNSHFPTHLEQLLWRIFAGSLTGLPLLFIAIRGAKAFSSGPLLTFTIVLCSLGGFLLYISSRVGLIILALMELRNLPLTGYQTVNWVNFIPHIG
ncbi:hypothetical protein L218DRAFT_992212 [Marasmius fiardii PR-910]|nr:hypothetical protein L218DRAFT_992212 [Marasmius fiardii PR-910]